MRWIAVSLAIAFSATACTSRVEFQRVGGEGLTHFVVVDEARAGDPAVFEEAVRRVCRGQSLYCSVLFWHDSALAARSFPLTEAQASAVVAAFRFHKPSAARGFGCYPWGALEDRCSALEEATSRRESAGSARGGAPADGG